MEGLHSQPDLQVTRAEPWGKARRERRGLELRVEEEGAMKAMERRGFRPSRLKIEEGVEGSEFFTL